MDLTYVDQGYFGERPVKAAAADRMALNNGRLPEAKRDFVLVP